jgi:hypothetical protein
MLQPPQIRHVSGNAHCCSYTVLVLLHLPPLLFCNSCEVLLTYSSLRRATAYYLPLLAVLPLLCQRSSADSPLLNYAGMPSLATCLISPAAAAGSAAAAQSHFLPCQLAVTHQSTYWSTPL